MPDHAVEDARDFDVGVVVYGNDLGTWAVLTHIVRHLANVLRQLVDGQGGTGIDRLSLDSTTGRQDIRGPLPVVVW